MAKVTIKLEGLDNLEIRLNDHAGKLEKELKELTKQSSSQVRSKARSGVRASNSFKSRIRVKDTSRYADRPKGLAKTVAPRSRRGHWFELGTENRHTRSPRRLKLGGRWVNVGTFRGNMDGQGFMSRAEGSVQPLHTARARAIIYKRVKI